MRGALGVVEFAAIPDMDVLKARFVAAGGWVRPCRTIAYLTPAQTIPADDLARLIEALAAVATAHGRAHPG